MSNTTTCNFLKIFPLPHTKNDLFFVFITAIALASLSIFYLYLSLSFELTSFPHRVQGIAILELHNVFIRQFLYFIFLITFFSIFTIVVSLLSIMVKHFSENYQSDTVLFEKQALTALSLIEILSIFFLLINKPCYEVQYYVFNGLFFGVLFILMFRWLLSTIGYSSLVIRCKLTPVTFGFFFLLTAIYLFLNVYKYPLDKPIDTRIDYPYGIMITFIIGWIISLFDKRYRFLKIGAPLLLLPLTILMASETQYIGLLRGYQWSLKTLLFLFTGSLLGLVIYIYTTAYRRKES